MLFTRADVEDGLSALVDELVSAGVPSTIHVVGGAAIALQAERDSLTADVDALQFPNPDVQAAVERVAQARRWPATWLNDAANMWASHFDSDEDWELRFSRGGVSVLVARAPLLLAMKLHAGRGRRDAGDIALLLDACGIGTMEAALAVFDKYFPTDVVAPKALRQLQDRFGSN